MFDGFKTLFQKFWVWLGAEAPQSPPPPALPQPQASATSALPPKAVSPVPPKPQYISIRVKKGDTLFNLAQTYQVSVRGIVQLNHLAGPEAILYVGQKLTLPRTDLPAPLQKKSQPKPRPTDLPEPPHSAKKASQPLALPPGSKPVQSSLPLRDSQDGQDGQDDVEDGAQNEAQNSTPDEADSPPPGPAKTKAKPQKPAPSIKAETRPAKPKPTPKIEAPRRPSPKPKPDSTPAKPPSPRQSRPVPPKKQAPPPKPTPPKPTPPEKTPPPAPPVKPEPQAAPISEPEPEPEIVAVPRYVRYTRPPTPPNLPESACRAVYLPYHALGLRHYRAQISQLIQNTPLNALVMDVKTDTGHLSYSSQLALAHDIKAVRPPINNLAEMVGRLKDNQVYTIARLVMFQDNVLAKAHPHLAAQQANGAELWFDENEYAWLDPFQTAVWAYLRQLVVEVARLGFDEILLSACHFPPPNHLQPPRLSQDSTPVSRSRNIAAFVGAMRGNLQPYPVKLALDLPGYACWREDDAQIGMMVNQLAPLVDTLCPVLWPQTLPQGVPVSLGEGGFEEAIFQSVRHLRHRLADSPSHIRPWLQAEAGQASQLNQLNKNLRAAINGGADGFMNWNANADYPREGYI